MAQGGYLVSKFDDCVSEVIKNIREDREKAEELINDAKNYIQQNVENHKTIGITMAKYIEAMQRSNEQLVKLTSILSKKTDDGISLSENDKNDLFDVIQGDKK